MIGMLVVLVLWWTPLVKVHPLFAAVEISVIQLCCSSVHNLQILYGAIVSGHFDNFSVGSWWIGVVTVFVMFTSVFPASLR
jgi:uncharacterized protein (DUF983 family)